MRLTLRTLLAYLDDILEPSQAQEIGRKTAESSFATALTHRIREVLRRRRLTAPELSGPGAGLDPNTVAEYLDNTLPPDGVADVEKVCLDSDAHLAEVAACHQILTLVLGEPVDVIPDSRERMYALGPSGSRASAAVADMPVVESARPADSREAARAIPDGVDASVPDYLKRKPLWRRALPFVAVVALLLVWLGLFAIDNPLNMLQNGVSSDPGVQGQPIAQVDQPAAGQRGLENLEPQTAATADTHEDLQSLDSHAQETAANSSVQPPVPAAADSQKEPIVTEAVPELVEPRGNPFEVADVSNPTDEEIDFLLQKLQQAVGTDEEPGTNTTPSEQAAAGEAVAGDAAGRTEVAAVVPPQVEAPQPEVPSRDELVPVQYQSQSGILLYKDAMHDDWMVMPRRSVVYPEDLIASPAPFDSELIVNQGTCRVTLVAGTRVRSLGTNRAGRFGFEVQQGRMVLEAHPGGPADEPETIALGLAVDEHLWRIELLTPNTVCGIEVVRRKPDHPDQKFEEAAFAGRVYVLEGTARLADGKEGIHVISAGNWRSLLPEAEKFVTGLSPVAEPLSGGLPTWIDRTHQASIVDQRNAGAFEKEFVADQSVRLSIPASVMSPRPSISELAVKCLALTRNESALVQALAQADHEEARLAAFHGLRAWLPQHAENSEKLRAELEGHFQPETITIIERLLWGFSADDLKKTEPQPTPSSQLLTWMAHEHPSVREMAFHYVSDLTGLRYSYRPLNPAGQRGTSMDRWRAHLEQEGALLK